MDVSTGKREPGSAVPQTHTSAAGSPTYFAVRTRFFDDEILAGLGTGVRQVVTLAAGVDGLTVRLDLPAGTRWFEVGLPEMTEFKDALITRCGLPLACERRGVAAHRRGDSQQALRAAVSIRRSSLSGWSRACCT
ncbi:class I SAM-dependent methyltransferase [Streptomyces sp. NPDC001537]